MLVSMQVTASTFLVLGEAREVVTKTSMSSNLPFEDTVPRDLFAIL